MCDKVRTALDMAKQRKNLTKGDIIVMFEQVVYDLSKQGDRMTNIEKRMESLESKMEAGFADIKKLIEEKNKRLTLFEKIMALSTHKYFWITLIVILLLLGGLMGVPTTGFNGLLTLGG